jgi:hypothetical protein
MQSQGGEVKRSATGIDSSIQVSSTMEADHEKRKNRPGSTLRMPDHFLCGHCG